MTPKPLEYETIEAQEVLNEMVQMMWDRLRRSIPPMIIISAEPIKIDSDDIETL